MKKTSKTRCNDWRMEKQPRLTEQFVELQKKTKQKLDIPRKIYPAANIKDKCQTLCRVGRPWDLLIGRTPVIWLIAFAKLAERQYNQNWDEYPKMDRLEHRRRGGINGPFLRNQKRFIDFVLFLENGNFKEDLHPNLLGKMSWIEAYLQINLNCNSSRGFTAPSWTTLVL